MREKKPFKLLHKTTLFAFASVLGIVLYLVFRSRALPSEIYLFANEEDGIKLSENIEASSSSFISPTTESSAGSMASEAFYFPVYITGEVHNPGVYHMEEGSYLYDLVNKAGGLTDKAAETAVNLACRLERESHVHIPSEEDLADMGPGMDGKPNALYGSDALADSSEAHSGKVDINKADPNELETLAGIGEKTARAIVEYREANGPFASIEAIMEVPGIKENKFSAIKDMIYVS